MPQPEGTTTYKIATINIENFKTNLQYVHDLLSQVDLLCVQEHWMYNYEIPTIKQYIPEVCYQVKCVDDANPISPQFRKKGNAGVMTIWPKSIDKNVTPLPDGSHRTLVTQLGNTSRPLFLINSYMPTVGAAENYSNVLDEVFELIQKYKEKGDIIWLGDLNASFHRANPSSNDKKFKSFCSELHLKPPDDADVRPTYHHFVGGIKSKIDHILTLSTNQVKIQNTRVESRHPTNMSSHDPVLADICTRAPKQHSQSTTPATVAKRKPNWKKISIVEYQQLTTLRLNSLLQHDGLDLPPEVLVDRLNSILLMSADDCGPQVICNKKRNNKYPWAESMKPLVKEIKQLFYTWKQGGRKPDDPVVSLMNKKKKELRSLQRQLAAEHRMTLLKDISQASTDNKRLFYKLVQRQRNASKELSNSVEFDYDCDSQIEGWATYFEQLASEEALPHFNNDYHNIMKLKLHLTSLQTKPAHEETPEMVNETQVKKHVKALKLGKAADVYGLTAEHIKHAPLQLISIITRLINTILCNQALPDQFKIGAIAPTHKKGKPIKNPDSYRRITVASNLGKLVEKEMMARTKPVAKLKQDPLQYGFTEKCSPSLCALLITEAIAEARDQSEPLYITFMDSSKAFDMVDHTILLNSLADLNIDPHLWHLYKDMYSKVLSRVRVNGQLSRPIHESRGIRQGGETSSEAFKAKENQFLTRVRTNPVSYRIGSIPVGIPTVADDNCMIASTHTGAQTQLLLAQDNASNVRYVFSKTKSKVMYIPDKATKAIPHMPLQFNDSAIDYSREETHLGLARTEDGKSSTAVHKRIQIGRRTAYALMGAGLYGVNGISPHVSKTLITTYVDPAVLYGLEALCMSDSDLAALDKFQRSLLRQIQSLPDSTAIPAIYLLLGILPLRAQVHQKILSLYNSILQRPNSVEYAVIQRQLAMKNTSSSSWTSQLRRTLHMYQLPTPLELASIPPSKQKWKLTVKEAIKAYWNKTLKEEASKMKSLQHLNLDMCSMGFSHPVWVCGSDPMQATMASTKATLLVGRYPVTAEKCAGVKQQQLCPLCNEQQETVNHFLLKCRSLQEHRDPYMKQLQHLRPEIYTKGHDEDYIVRNILDPSHIAYEQADILLLESITRRMCYTLHNHRAINLGTGSMSGRALGRLSWVRGGKRVKQQANTQQWGSPA
jgi:hypothetical protein